MAPAPNLKHRRVLLALAGLLDRFVKESGLGEVLPRALRRGAFRYGGRATGLAVPLPGAGTSGTQRRQRAGRAGGGGRDPVSGHRRPGPGIPARALREARRGGVLAGRPGCRDDHGSSSARGVPSWPRRPAAAERPCARRPSEASRRIRATCSPPAEAPGPGQAAAGFPETGRLARPSSFAVSHGTLKRFPRRFPHPSVSPGPAGCPGRPPRLPAPPGAQAQAPIPTPS